MKATPSRILTSILAGLLFGVAFASYGWPVLVLFGVCAVGWVVSSPSFKEGATGESVVRSGSLPPSRGTKGVLLTLFTLSSLLGIWRYSLATPSTNSVAFHLAKNASVTGVIMTHSVGEKGETLTLERLAVNGEQVGDKILTFVPLYSHGELGDRVGVHCDLEAPEPLDGFRYDRYLAAKSIYAQCYSRSEPFILKREEVNNPKVILGKIHEKAVGEIRRTYGEPHAQLLAGLLLGDNSFSDKWKQKFITTGTSHVVAASGYNVALVSSLALAFLIYAGLRRQYAFPFVLFAIASFVIIAGGSGAVLRAGIMGAIAVSATQLGRKSSARNALLLTTAIMVMIEPRILRDDTGFQLSVLSTTGLIAFAKPIAAKLEWIPEAFGLRESLSCTLAATFATLPVIIFGFHRLSIIGPVTNLLVLPFLPYAMATGTFGVLVHVFTWFPLLGGIKGGLVLPGWLFLDVILRIIDAMAALPFAAINL